MKRTAATRCLTLLAASLLVAGTAVAAGQGERVRGRAGLLRRALASLDLTQAQKTDIRAAFEKAKPSLEDLGARLKSDREALRAAAGAEQPDPAAVGKAFLNLRTDRADLRSAFEKLLSEIRTILTPEQAAKLDGYLAAMKHRRG